MADPGSVSYLFTRKGVVVLEKNGRTEDDLLEIVLEAGAEEINDLGESFEIVCEAGDLIPVRTALVDAGVDYESADPDFRASVEVPVDAEGARRCSSSSTPRGLRRRPERLHQRRRLRRGARRTRRLGSGSADCVLVHRHAPTSRYARTTVRKVVREVGACVFWVSTPA